MVTLQKLLDEAMISGDLLNLDRHITRTVQRWMADASDAFYMIAVDDAVVEGSCSTSR